MSLGAGRSSSTRSGAAERERRRELREEVVRRVDYAPFPRVTAGQRPRVGFTRDLSASGLCLRSETSERIGSLLRIVVRSLDGRPARESIGRVAWSSSTADGAFWLGLSLIEDKPGELAAR